MIHHSHTVDEHQGVALVLTTGKFVEHGYSLLAFGGGGCAEFVDIFDKCLLEGVETAIVFHIVARDEFVAMQAFYSRRVACEAIGAEVTSCLNAQAALLNGVSVGLAYFHRDEFVEQRSFERRFECDAAAGFHSGEYGVDAIHQRGEKLHIAGVIHYARIIAHHRTAKRYVGIDSRSAIARGVGAFDNLTFGFGCKVAGDSGGGSGILSDRSVAHAPSVGANHRYSHYGVGRKL